MSFDDIVAEAEKIESEIKQPARASKQQLDIVALAETVARINKATEQSTLATVKAARALTDAPEALKHAVREGFQESLKELNNKEQALSRREAAIDKRVSFWLYLTLGTAVVLGSILILASTLWFVPEFKHYAEYRDSHEAIVQGSVYGARVVENDNGVFVVFDEGVTIGDCSMPNCVSVE